MKTPIFLAAVALAFSFSVSSVAQASSVLTLPLNTSGAVNSYFDHTSPTYALNGNLTRYDGQVFTGNAASPTLCSLGGGCYDGHNGIDYQASTGTAVYAAADGVVKSIGWENPSDHSQGFGYFIRLWHSALLDSTLYGHLTENSQTAGLAVNSAVTQNATLALSGSTGNSSGPHLHFSVFNVDGSAVSNSIDPFGWSGSGSDPWTIDQGYLWTTNPPSHTPSSPPTPGNISVTSAGVTHSSLLSIGSGASFSYTVQNTGQQSFALSNLDMQVTGPNSYSSYLGAQSLSTLAVGGNATYSFSATNFLSTCSTCSQGTYTFSPKYRDTGGTVHDVLYAAGGSAAVSLNVLSPVPVTSLKLNSGNTELFTISQSGAFLRNETVGVGPGGWSGWNQPLSQSVTFTGRVWPVLNSQGYEEVFARDTSGNLWRTYNSPTGWHSWISFGAFQTPSNPSAIGYDSSGNLELYVLGMDGNVYHNWEGSFDSWSGFNSLANGSTVYTSSIWPAKNSAGRAEIFVRDTSGNIWNDVSVSGGWSWHGFTGFQTPSDPTAVRYDAAGDLELYVLGTDGNVYHNWEGSLGNWSGFYSLGNGGLPAIGSVWPIINGGRAQLFMRDSNNHLWTNPNTAGGWSGWSSVGGSFQSLTDPSAVLDYHGYPNVLIEGTDSHLYQAYNTTGSWGLSDLSTLPSSSSYVPSANRAVPLKLGGGSMELFNVSSIGQVLVNKTSGTGPGGWGGWSQISPTTQSAFYVGRPWVVINSQGYEEVFVRDVNNAVWRTYNTASGWHQWEQFASFQSLSDPVAISYDTNHDLALFLRGTNNMVYYYKETGFNTWAGYTQAPTASMTLGGGVWAIANSAGNPELFVQDTSGNIWYIANPLNSSSVWQQVGNFHTSSDPTAVPYATNGYLEMYARGTDGNLYHSYEGSPGSWSGMQSLGNGATSFSGSVWPMVNSSNRPQVLVRDSSNHIWNDTNVVGGWSGWGQVGTYQSIIDPTATLDANGYPELFIEGNDGNIYQSYYSASAWSGWTSLGNPN